MFISRFLAFLDVQGILEGDLLVWFLTIILGDGLLQRFEVEEVEGIAEAGEEFSNTTLIDMLRIVERTLHLHLLFVTQFLLAYIFK